MKKFIIGSFLLICASEAFSQTAQKSETVQCAGKTKKNEQCKHRINPKNPNKAVMDAGGVFYCFQHVKQAKK